MTADRATGCGYSQFVSSQEPRQQTPNSKLQRSTKLQAQKPTRAPFAPPSVIEVWCLRFGTSLELGVWCLGFRSAPAQRPRCAPDPPFGGVSAGDWGGRSSAPPFPPLRSIGGPIVIQVSLRRSRT